MSSRAFTTETLTGCNVAGKKILVVGAGGIGCELVKNLVLTGFDNITMSVSPSAIFRNLNLDKIVA